MSYVFDASSILLLTRELGGKVLDLAKESFTASLAYYEIGNALWKECNLLKTLNIDEAVKALKFTFSLFKLMKIVHAKDVNLGVQTLLNAGKLNVTYYDAAYISIAKELGKVLVTDDEKLAIAAEKTGVETLPSKHFTGIP